MDYIENFKNLRTNNKYGRKSPHKAILMLAVIELYEQNVLKDNEIFYDDKLKSMFLKVWNRVLPNEPLFHPDAYLPFWYLQSDSFWHIIPIRGKEDILSLMRDANIKPSEAKLNDSVRCAELDEDLYFLMTISSGRSSLKRALLETYTQLSEYQIERMTESTDNFINHSLSAMNEYEQILSSKNNDEKEFDNESSSELEKQFKKLNDDLQIVLNYEYFAFLKKHRGERNMLREVCPNVHVLYDRIINHPIQRTDLSLSFAFIYDNFLSDLKISLMGEEGSMELIDKIGEAIEILRGIDKDEISFVDTIDPISTGEENKNEVKSDNNDEPNYDDLEIEYVHLDKKGHVVGTSSSSIEYSSDKKTEENRRGKPWTKDEDKSLTYFYNQGRGVETLAKLFGRTEVAIKSRLGKLGLINYTYGQDNVAPSQIIKASQSKSIENDFIINNSSGGAAILNKHGERVFVTDGKLKYLHEKLYRLNLKPECFTVKDMQFDGYTWEKGRKKIVAYSKTDLYIMLSESDDYCRDVEDIIDDSVFENCRLKFKGVWYSYNGSLKKEVLVKNIDTKNQMQHRDASEIKNRPLYAVRRQAVLCAMDHFRVPATIRDIVKAISRTAWGSIIKEEDVEDIISTISVIESVGEKYILQRKNS